ncbi:MAG: hypothetical protein FWB86_03620 [Treponema sp.]|nr:hypothetical protein [Treponema sp.]MCL2250421.1 hypothetical protein [Treponema sp.]
MKKIYYFLVLVLAISIFGCTLPSEIKVIGNPEFEFVVNMDFGKVFKEKIDEALNGNSVKGLQLLDCVNEEEVQTYLIVMDAFNETFEFELSDDNLQIDISNITDIELPDILGSIDVSGIVGDEITVDGTRELYDTSNSSNAPIVLTLSALGESLYGFAFNLENVKASLVFSGSDICSIIDMEIVFKDEDDIELLPPIVIPVLDLTPSGISSNDKTYTNGIEELPGLVIGGFGDLLKPKGCDGGLDCDHTACAKGKIEDIYIFLKVKITSEPGNVKTIQTEWLDEPVNISAKLLLWLPFELEAADDIHLSLDDFLNGAKVGEFVGNFAGSMSDYMEQITLTIGMKNNPFKDGELYMEVGDIAPIASGAMDSDSIKIQLSKSDMESISGSTPKFMLGFNEGDSIKIPRDCKITTVSIETNIDYTL